MAKDRVIGGLATPAGGWYEQRLGTLREATAKRRGMMASAGLATREQAKAWAEQKYGPPQPASGAGPAEMSAWRASGKPGGAREDMPGDFHDRRQEGRRTTPVAGGGHVVEAQGPVRPGPRGTSLIAASCKQCGADVVRGSGAWRHSTW